ncbi:gluconokinase [Streptomyces sp. NPDC006458]|uniref:gluconokinase n=1 Tax=Streptomyces sp. NPDC006458 TaxID=3154302 RepID=UPI00339FF0A6
MGVSASGKSTVGARVAQRLGVPFLEGDDLHPAANRAKMASGHPLDDGDRGPWLAALADRVRAAAAGELGGVVSCSALKRAYRDHLRGTGANLYFVYLALDHRLAEQRIAGRQGHFMPPSLLDSQYEILQPLEADEPGVTIDASGSREQVLALVVQDLVRSAE